MSWETGLLGAAGPGALLRYHRGGLRGPRLLLGALAVGLALRYLAQAS